MWKIDEPLRSPGMRDLLPVAMARFRRLGQVFRETCLAWGYQEIRTPTIEYLHLFTTAGTLPPQMLSRVYSFLDWDGWSGERVVLRPDATIPAVRLYLEQLKGQPLAKLFYVQNVFRFTTGDQPRELWQCGLELIGESAPAGDVELILLGVDVLERLGLGPVQVQLSHPGIVREVLAHAGLGLKEQEQVYDSILAGDLSDLPRLEQARPELALPLRLLFQLEGGGSEYVSNLYSVLTRVVPGARAPLEEVRVVGQVLETIGCDYRVEAGAVGPFEYYTGPAFQFEARGTKVGGGGRYDHLVALVGGEETPATGCALDAEAILPLLTDERGEIQVVTVISGTKAEEIATAFKTAQHLRRAGLPASVLSRSINNDGWELRVTYGDSRPTYSLNDLRGKALFKCESLDDVVDVVKGNGRN